MSPTTKLPPQLQAVQDAARAYEQGSGQLRSVLVEAVMDALYLTYSYREIAEAWGVSREAVHKLILKEKRTRPNDKRLR